MEDWHNDVREWFDSGVVGLNDTERVLEDAGYLMGCFHYGKPQLVNGDFSPHYDIENRRLVFKDALSFQPTRLDGECLELASWVQLCLSRKHEVGAKLKIVQGTEPDYFRCDRSEHTFLVLIDGDKEWIIDPSFRKISQFKGSSYMQRGPVLTRSTDLSLSRGLAAPISMKNDVIRFLCWGSEGVYIGEQKKGYEIEKTTSIDGEGRLLSSVRLVLPAGSGSLFSGMMSGFMRVM